MKICFVVRNIQSQIAPYTTTHLAYEAFVRGHTVVYATVNSFSYSDDQRVRATIVSPGHGPFTSRSLFLEALKGEQAERDEVTLSDFDVVFLRYNPNETESERDRKNPAIEFARLLKTHGVFVVNDPGGLTKASSKMYLSGFPEEIRAKTLITRSAVKIKEFIKRLRRPAILKPLSGYGGQDVFFVKNSDEININQIISTVAKNGYIMAQEYLPAIKQGDKRLLLLNGQPILAGDVVAMYRRMSPRGEIRANIHIGGTRKKASYTSTDSDIVDTIRARLVADGLYFVGADIVGNKLLEINVFCPGGINNINELYNVNIGGFVIEDLQRRVRLNRSLVKPDSISAFKLV